MKHKYTHIAQMRGADRRVPRDWRRSVKLRQTKTMWVTEHGARFRKSDCDLYNGTGFGNWPMYRLVNIAPIEHDH